MSKLNLSRLTTLALGMALALGTAALPARAEEEATPQRLSWSFWGPFGSYDQAQLQRGFKVYREVCSACHSLHRVAFRNLSDPGGPAFTEGQVKALAAEYDVPGEPDDKGEVNPRKGRPADYFPLVFANDNAARAANNGAIPPDMSLLAKARGESPGFPGFIFDIFRQYQEGGPDYIHALITNGYLDEAKGEKPPEGVKVPDGAHYNKIFPAPHFIAMAKPISDGQVEYTDGTPQTVDQYTRDVAAFLMWAAEPKLEERKRTGFKVILFLVVLSGLLYFTKKRVWSAVGAH
ncbi:cytochrome c1 [Labrys wisconsinensis]|uniref:Cytochrome c1 n=1 Tax=Labrys wisconsinensis TaxID=425677 RepID=A0ABU0JH85_9HYPH|nr:ubiquinol-cytochrome c reductase cytochrome b/c1 subunit [Labrys wisconsinensis]